MKRSEFIKKVLKSKDNTVFTTKEQVENSLELFEKLGMSPPTVKSLEYYKDWESGLTLSCTKSENKWDKEE